LNLVVLPVAQEAVGSILIIRPKFEPKPPGFQRLTPIAPYQTHYRPNIFSTSAPDNSS
jgi:hypothetical protein